MKASVSVESLHSDPPTRAAPSYPSAAVLVLLGLISGTVVIPFVSNAREHAAHVLKTGLDPNVAPWWELSLLPRLGPSVAKEIVDYRTLHDSETARACTFRQAADLLSVRGIGPKTLLRIGPHLRFDACRSESPIQKREDEPPP